MKLWRKGTAVLLLLSMILMQTVAFAQDRTADLKRKMDRLDAFGIISSAMVADQTPMTRGEMADLVVRASNNVAGVGMGLAYDDVPADHPYAGAIELANTLGFVGIPEDKMFNPDQQITMMEALVMVTNAMGYADIALASGGFPEGYKKVANDQDLTKGITNQLLTKEDAVRMISNMMDANSVHHLYYENNPSLTTSSYVTFLEDTFEVRKYKAEITEVSTSKKTITATITDGAYTGVSREYTVGEKVAVEAVGGKVTLYVDKNDHEFVVYIETRSGSSGVMSDEKLSSGIVYDFISATNKNDLGTNITKSDWKYVSFTNLDATYKIADEWILTYSDVTITNEAYNYVGAFTKAVVQDGAVVRMDVYPLKEGGIIYRADADELRFSVGTEYENYWKGFANAPDLQIFIDGKPGYKMQDLKSNMVFDYWHEGGDKFIIVASSRVAKGVLTDIDSEVTIIGGIEYKISEPYGWYSFSARELGFITGDIREIYNKDVIAYIDDNQRVRYIVPEIGKDETQIFKGFVVKAYGDDDLDNRYIKIHRIDGVGVETYKVKRKLRGDSLTFEYAKSVQSNLDAMGFLEFTLDENNEICLIEKIDNFGDDVRTHTGYFAESYHVIGGLYADEATIFALMNIDGAFTVKQIGYANELTWTTPGNEGVKVISDFNLKENPIPDYIVLGRGSETICDSISQFDIIESVKWTGVEDIYNIKFIGGDTFDVDKAFIDRYGLKKNCMVKYGEKSLGKYRFSVGEVVDLSGNAEDWVTDTYQTGANRGFFRASSIVERNHDVIQFVADGVNTDLYLYRNDNTAGYYAMKIYEYLGKGKIQKARDSSAVGVNIAWYIRPVLKYPVMNIQKGDDVWFHLYDDGSGMMTIDYMIYKSNNTFFE